MAWAWNGRRRADERRGPDDEPVSWNCKGARSFGASGEPRPITELGAGEAPAPHGSAFLHWRPCRHKAGSAEDDRPRASIHWGPLRGLHQPAGKRQFFRYPHVVGLQTVQIREAILFAKYMSRCKSTLRSE